MNRILDTLFYLSNKILRPYPLCHSLPDRSLSYHGRYFGLCARCTGMYASGVLTVLVIILWELPFDSQSSVLFGGLLLIPGGIDGFTQLIGNRESTNRLRILTGILLGIGVVLFLFGSIEFLIDIN
ncbi:DUF2085 domain-containing protein [Halobacterium salinarum]|uniref:DUF2085 family protein n=3 Tax=Halobacterium salinarum NRC-34001 TaxID=2886895 RepID=A0A510N638_HALSA|nr:DUF2085 domain-containing protein [Halobacterium salinarum]UEB93107.1 DUF2085 domain-containing protein [Halobacterium salinarum NRC-34001]CAP13680.1 DUF2085 family protein [Halobacterium salinarum R1]DAC78114.1 TPA_inf: DUF2085 family protein [Halobacterium salinarum NRC-1]